MGEGLDYGNVNDELSETINSYPADETPAGGVVYRASDRPAIDWGAVFGTKGPNNEPTFDINRALDKGLSAWLQKETIDANAQLLRAGRSVGYMPGYSYGNPYGYGVRQPLDLGRLLPLALIAFVVVKAMK